MLPCVSPVQHIDEKIKNFAEVTNAVMLFYWKEA